MISDNELLHYNLEGLIPGPGEAEDAFLQRAIYCMDIKVKLQESELFPFKYVTESLGQGVFNLTKSLYGINPTWVPATISNYKLAPWHGGCAWIFQLHNYTPISAFLQLRKGKSWFYDRDEIVAHEMAHVGRMAFDEPFFEEMLAYQSSAKAYKRWLGPVIQSPKESTLFFLTLFLLIALDMYLLVTGQIEMMAMALWLKAIPVLVVFAALFRLIRRHATFNATLGNLAGIRDVETAQAIIYRLSDEEIFKFAKFTTKAIEDYASKQNCLRWKLIRQAYINYT